MNIRPYISTRISASAGSGKTYQLSLRFIALLVLGVPPERMIALTFTRKAAAEFADRIMFRLAKGAADENEAARLAGEVAETIRGDSDHPGLVPEGTWDGPLPDRGVFLSLLRSMVSNLGRLNMSTLDSFFARMAMALSLDLGLAAIEVLEDDRLADDRARVLQELYSHALLDEGEREAFLTGFKLATAGRENERLDTSLREFVEKYHDLYLQNPEREKWGNEQWIRQGAWWDGAPERWKIFTLLRHLVEERKGDLPAGFFNQLDKFVEFSLTRGTFKWPSIFSTEFVQDLRRGIGDFSYSRKEYHLDPVLVESLLAVCGAVVKDLVLSGAERMRGMYSLMNRFEMLYSARVRAAGRFMFSDVARLLLPEEYGGTSMNGELAEPMAGLQFRMDGWYDHWMLDEFQDTSLMQWRIVEPFLDEVVQDAGGGRSLFVVGDAKQSIYQWRGGSPKIFEGLATQSPWRDVLQEWSMDVSYRSSPVVLSFVNHVCDFKRTAPDASPGALDRWIFHPHRAEGTAEDLDGCVQVWEVEKTDRDDILPGKPEHRAVTALLKRVRPLERGLGCAILVGSNAHAAAMREWLTSEPGGGFAADVEADVSVGSDSSIGLVLTDFFRWLSHPGDRFAWNHCLQSPLRHWLSRGTEHTVWRTWKRLYECSGVSAVLTEWERLLDRELPGILTDFQRNRLGIWKSESAVFDARGGSLDDWLRMAETMKKREHTASRSIQIMTWHKAKGLEFDMVVLPTGPMKAFANKTHLEILREEDVSGDVRNMIFAPPSDTADKDETLAAMTRAWAEEQEYEGFCKLYVAMTRAKRALYLFLPPEPKTAAASCGVRTILRHACSSLDSEEDSLDGSALSNLATMGHALWYESFPIGENAELAGESLAYRLPSPVRRKSSLSPSVLEEGGIVLPERGAEDARRLGTLVHALFEKLEWFTGEFPQDGADPEAAAMVKSALESDEFRKWLIRPEGDVRLWRECPVAGMIEGNPVNGIADRVMLQGDRLTVLDFKTDEEDSPSVLETRHASQLRCYRDLLCRVFRVPEERAQCVILAVRSGRAVVFR